MKKIIYFLMLIPGAAFTQNDSLTTQDQLFNRPFINASKSNAAVGGYFEGNTNYFAQDGISEGFSMELRRFNLFLFSSVGPRIRFLSELEFEHGVEEINLETAMIDFRINNLLSFRAGILLTPLGAFNQNHDGPRWEIIDRPLVSTRIIPSTLSEVGFGLSGKRPFSGGMVTYDLYALNGLGDGLILNSEGRTSTAMAKHPEMFAEDNNGTPSFSGRLGLRMFRYGEAGLSWYGGVYNSFRTEGDIVDEKRRLDIFAFDFNAGGNKFTVQGEAAFNLAEVPDSISELYGERQYGAFIEFNYQLMQRPLLKWQKTRLLASLRLERVDLNHGIFRSTGAKIFDEENALVAGISWRPAGGTVIRANYRIHSIRDLAGNPASRLGGFQFGVASYF